jgi:hypothetical protein
VPLPVVVSLTVDSAPQPGLGEQFFFDATLLSELDLRLEDVDFARPGGGHAPFQLLLVRRRCTHEFSALF